MSRVLRLVLLMWALGGIVQSAAAGINHSSAKQGTETAPNSPDKNQALNKQQQDFFAKLDVLKKQGRAAFSDEMAREKAGDCPHAVSTYDMVTCLGREVEKTTANYRDFVGALRSVEHLKSPGVSYEGPSGQPLSEEELVKEFDEAESAWQIYHKAQCTAAYGAHKSGTIAPVMEVTCHLQLMRDRMRELENIYQFMD